MKADVEKYESVFAVCRKVILHPSSLILVACGRSIESNEYRPSHR